MIEFYFMIINYYLFISVIPRITSTKENEIRFLLLYEKIYLIVHMIKNALLNFAMRTQNVPFFHVKKWKTNGFCFITPMLTNRNDFPNWIRLAV